MASPKPAVIVRREFEATPDVVSQQLRACIVGPSCQLVRYGVAAEKSNGFIATVATRNDVGHNGGDKSIFTADATYSIPSIAYSSLLDADYAKIYVDDAYVTYAQLAASTNFSTSLSAGQNYISASNSSQAWKGLNRNGNLVQDVAVGDIVQIYTSSGLAHSSVVTGFTGTEVAAATGTIGGTQASNLTIGTGISSASTGSSQSNIGNVTGASFALSLANYLTGTSTATYGADPRIVGKTITNYVLTVTAVSSSTVDYYVESDTGLDSATVSGKISGNATTLPSGATVAISWGTALPAVNTKVSFSITVAHTKLSITATSGGGTFGTVGSPGTGQPSTTYILTCIKGGSNANENGTSNGGAQFQVTTNNGADVTQTFTLLGVVQSIPIGSYGLTLTTALAGSGATPANQAKGFVKGDVYTISVTGASVLYLDKLVFADAVPSTITASNLRLSKKKNIQLPKYQPDNVTANWSLQNAADSDSRSILIENILRTRDSSVNSGQSDVWVTAGKFYVEYRAFQALTRQVGSVNTLSDITTQLGTIHPDNPLAYGVYKAWTNANGATVHFIPTVSQTLNGTRGFADALALAKGNRNCYGLVPLTTSSEIWQAFVGHVTDESAPTAGRFRVLWIAPEVDLHYKIQDQDSSGVYLYGSSVLKSAGQYYVNAVSEQGASTVTPKFTENVQVGDYIRTKFTTDSYGRTTYTEYKIISIVDNDTVVVSSATDPAINNYKIEIYRDLSSAAAAQKYAQVSGGFSSERVFAVVPDRGLNGMRVDGTPVKNWFVACAFAGLRSGSRPQQPLSNVELLGFDGTNITPQLFNETDLDTLRDGGVWVVRNTDDGRIYSERQLSTSTLDLYRKEQSVTCNVDSISFSTSDALRSLVGRVNITPDTTVLVKTILAETLAGLAQTSGAVTVGPQLISYEIVSITVPATAQDTLTVKVSVTVPLPMNIIDITLVI